MTGTGIASCLPVALRLAEAARPLALRHFRTSALTVEDKSASGESYDPVTMADRAIELEIRRIIAAERPEDGITGEEFDDIPTRSGVTWVIDPIDGTRAFLCGLPSWGVLIAANDGTRPVIGIMDQPFTGERFVGTTLPGHHRATLDHAGTTRDLATRDTTDLSQAVACCTDPSMFGTPAERAAFDALCARTRMMRLGTDCYGYAMLAMGQVDLVVESALKSVDIQPMIPIVEAAGGIVTDWQGGDPQDGGQVIAAATTSLHQAALAALSAP